MSARVGPSVTIVGDRYQLVPAKPLPSIDLSVSVQSRLLPQRYQQRVSCLITQGRLILGLYIVGNVLSIASVACNAPVGRMLALPAALLVLPAPLSGLAVLRLNMIQELAKTFDLWFFFVTRTSAIAILMAQLADVRILVPLGTLCCLVPNMLFDANLRGAKRMAISNALAIVALLVVLGLIKLVGIDDTNNFAIFRQGKRVFYSNDCIVNGLTAMVAMLARNLVRIRRTLASLRGKHLIVCVSYRSVLRLVPRKHIKHSVSGSALTLSDSTRPGMGPIQSLQLKEAIDNIDTRHVIWPAVFRVVANGTWWMPMAHRVFVWGSFVLSTAVSTLVSLGTIPERFLVVARSVMLVCIVIIISASAVTYLRQLLWSLISSFDFLYFSSQLTVIHLIACDFWAWDPSRTLVVLTSWLWIHWALCIDAVSPLVKNSIRIHRRFPAVVFLVSFVNYLVFVYAVVGLDTADDAYNRVVPLFNFPISVSVMPVFLNSVSVVLMISTRLLYRAWTFDSDMLLVLEGDVVIQATISESLVWSETQHRTQRELFELPGATILYSTWAFSGKMFHIPKEQAV